MVSVTEPLPERLGGARSILRRQRSAEQSSSEVTTQLAELKATVEMQGELMKRLLSLLEKEHEGKGKQRARTLPTGLEANGSAYETEQVWS